MKSVSIGNILSRKKELTGVLTVAGVFLISIIIVYIYIFNFLPRTSNLIKIYGSNDNFQEIRDNIAEANQAKLALEESITSEENRFQSRNEDKFYQELISLAKSSGLKIISFEELGTIIEENYLKSSTTLEMAGSYLSIIKYIKRIETDVFPVTVRSLNVFAPSSISTTLECEVALTIYRNANE